MTPPRPADLAATGDSPLPVHDRLVLPIIAVLTILLLAVGTEWTARWLYPVSTVGFDGCFATHDASGDAPVKPNGVCRERVVESPFPVEYRFNSQGNRAGMEPWPKSPGVYRIVMIGSSMAMGLFVPRELTFAATLPVELSRLSGQKVELYNAATGGKFRGGPFPTRHSAAHFKETLAAAPDMVLWVITPKDIENEGSDGAGSDGAADTPPGPAGPAGPAGAESLTWSAARIAAKLHDWWERTRTSLVLKHLLIAGESQDQYITSYLKNDEDAGFLKIHADARWRNSLQRLRADAGEFARQANAAGVPFVAVLIPNRAEAAMISRGQWPAGYDPYQVGEELRTLIEGAGGTYLDILHALRAVPNPEQHYFPIDGHLDADGHAMISRLLASKLATGTMLRSRLAAQPAGTR